MTMDPTATHPSDELLAAFAGADHEATGDRALSEHVSACARCGSVVRELQELRLALAQLPDVAPPRPLRVLHPVEEPGAGFAERLAAFSRRAFAPLMVVGAGLVVVGAVGGTANLAGGMASAPGAEPPGEVVRTTDGVPAAPDSFADEGEEGGLTPTDGAAQGDTVSPQSRETVSSPEPGPASGDDFDTAGRESPFAALGIDELPVWLMLLSGGGFLMAVAVMLRFVVAPRAG